MDILNKYRYIFKKTFQSMAQKRENNNKFSCWLSFYLNLAALKGNKPSFVDILQLFVCSVLILISIVNGCILIGLTVNDTNVNVAEILSYVFVEIHALFTYITLFLRRKQINSMVKSLEQRYLNLDFVCLQEYYHILDQEDKKSLLYMRSGSRLVFVGMGILVYKAHILFEDRSLIYPMWAPFSEEDKFYFVYIFVQISVFVSIVFSFFSSCGVFVGMAHFLGGSYEMLGLAIQDMTNPSGDAIKVNIVDTLVERKLKYCVQIHNQILR